MPASKSRTISKKPTAGDDPQALRKPSRDDPQALRELSRDMLKPAVIHSLVTQTYSGDYLDQQAICDGISEKARAVVAGDMSSSERILVAQATTLNTVCVHLFLRAHNNLGQHIGAAETYLKLALKAQNQCRMTLETLANIKNPPIVYARQANFAAGPQQVNNGVVPHAVENQTAPNELLEDHHGEGERLDGGAPGQAIGSNPALAAVGAINRATER